ncbi:MAG TPA: sodium:proton antiporter [Microbacteriaceae bacterium]|nr:sodium:proton antiporter [Microbacteriaceae bacterium]
MEFGVLAVAAVLIVVAVSAFASKLGVAAPILLVIIGIGCSLIPGAPELEIPPEWILAVVLPPILYAAAVNMPAMDFRRDFGAIGALSVLLVIVSAFISGTVIWLLFPDLDFAAAVAVGAVISPPDAVAATSIGKRLGLPQRLVTILEGEGLVNDATALVMLRSSVAAIAGAISFWGAIGDFAYAVVGAIVIGGLIGGISVWVRSRLRQPVLTTAISFVVPFLAYIPAEEVGASGVLAVVVAGLVTGHFGVRKFTPQDRIAERMNWRTIQLLLENGVFLAMGFELTAIITDVVDARLGVGGAIGIGLIATAVLLVVRVAFVVPLIGWLRLGQRRAERQTARLSHALGRLDSVEPRPEHVNRLGRVRDVLRRQHADASYLAREGLGWRGGAVIAWSGMRGVVTLAAAQSLPADLPYRSQLVLVAFTVAIVTLVVQGGTLPYLIRLLGISGSSEQETRRELALLTAEIGESVRELLDDPELRRESGGEFDPEIVSQVRSSRLSIGESLGAVEDWEAGATPLQQQQELRRRIFQVEQAALLDARASGTYSSHIIQAAQQMIDSQAAGLSDSP